MTRCEDCAFTPGTEANLYVPTQTITELSVLGHIPFYCHKRAGMCAGWIEAVSKQKQPPDWKSRLAQRMIDLIHDGGLRTEEQIRQAIIDATMEHVDGRTT